MSRPVILLGHGIRAAGAAHLAPRLLELGVPVLASWQAKDLVDNDHPMFLGCPGIYGNRAANKALAGATEILAIGNRLAIWNVGYGGIREDQELIIVSLDEAEAKRYPHATWIREDCKSFLERSILPLPNEIARWRTQCLLWRAAHPWVESPAHDDTTYINSYRFFDALHPYLRSDEAIAIDCGAACASAFQTLRVKPPQRIYSSGGLGEMGCALPAAIGVSFARDKGPVLCIIGDGAMMMNLQELQTIVHHQLPVKIIVCRNEGYLMLKHTQRGAGMAYAGVDAASGMSLPDFRRIALAFGITAGEVRTWDDYRRIVPGMLSCEGPCLIEYIMHPEQPCVPKLSYKVKDGKPIYDTFDQMSPSIEAM
jgi:acetolactate synthase-1/2/3 large subunit